MSTGRILEHKDCGGEVDHFAFRGTFECHRCRKIWSRYYMLRMNDAELGARFVIKPLVDREEYRLVWAKDETTGRRHTMLVKAADAHKFERFEL